VVPTDVASWRALVDKELAGAPFDKLIHTTAEGIALQPLYTEWSGDAGVPGAAPFVRGSTAAGDAQPARVCTRVGGAAEIADDVEGGADVLWLDITDAATFDATLAAAIGANRELLVETDRAPAEAVGALGAASGGALARVVANDPITRAARGRLAADHIATELDAIARCEAPAGLRYARVSSVPFHDAGADAADELALLLSSGVAVLRAFDATGRTVIAANAALAMQVAIGRDTFGEICKLRALRTCWHRILAAAGAPASAPPPVHAVGSTRAQSQRDPWVNMLRTTTQVFAAMIGGAAWVTPAPFDATLSAPSALGRRVARNTALVLRDESHLGHVVDAAGGSYYIEARTDALAREAWTRFQAIEKEGGVVALLASGALHARLAASWKTRAAAVARRKEPVLGVSEFANLDEKLPAPTTAAETEAASGSIRALPRHRDAEGFEALRARVESAPDRDIALLTLGPPAEFRGRAGYAATLLSIIGLRTRESAAPVAADIGGHTDIAVICGSDERYATEAADAARALRAAGVRKIVLAGRPGALEPDLRAAGVDAFVFVGADVLTTLTELVS
jgi:methylmalonyl-CoA mutase